MPFSYRLKALIVWLGDSAEVALQKSEMLSLNNGYGPAPHEAPYFTLPHPAAPHVHCIAAILWYSHSLPVRNELRTIITPQLFRYFIFSFLFLFTLSFSSVLSCTLSSFLFYFLYYSFIVLTIFIVTLVRKEKKQHPTICQFSWIKATSNNC